MRTTLQKIDFAAQKSPPEVQDALYSMLAQTLATQALALAAHKGETIDAADAQHWISLVAGYPGVEMAKSSISSLSIGQQAIERLKDLADLA